MSDNLLLAAATTLTRSGLIRPVRPTTLARMGHAAYKNGTTLATLGALGAARWPEHIAVIDDRGQITYRQLQQHVAALTHVLKREYGVGPDRPLAVMCRNHRGFITALLAGAAAGADLLLLNTDFPGPQLAQVLERGELGLIVCDAEFIQPLRDAGHDGALLLSEPSATDGRESGLRSIDDVVVGGLHSRIHKRPRAGKITLLTSGTTGTPKGAPRTPSARSFAGAALSAIGSMDIRTGDRVLIGPPLFHGFGMAFLGLGLLQGCTLVLHRRFDADAVAQSIGTHHVEHLVAVPVMLQRLLRDPRADQDLGTLKAVLTGAAPLTPALASEFMDTVGDILFNGYGSSEVGVASLARPSDLRAAPGTVGRSVLDTTIRILDELGKPLPANTIGDIYVGGAMVFEGYTGGGDKRRVSGLVSTGDRGHLDESGRLFIAGREDDMIVSGGENVYPQEVEDVLRTHPSVADAAVLGVPDDEFGQRLQAFVVLREGAEPANTDQLIQHLRAHVARYKVPRELIILGEIPRNPTGKVLKGALATQ